MPEEVTIFIVETRRDGDEEWLDVNVSEDAEGQIGKAFASRREALEFIYENKPPGWEARIIVAVGDIVKYDSTRH